MNNPTPSDKTELKPLIDPDRVINGTIWKCKWPQCWTMIVQWLDKDQYLIMTEPDKATHGGTCSIAHWTNGKIIQTREEICKWLEKMEAVEVKATLEVKLKEESSKTWKCDRCKQVNIHWSTSCGRCGWDNNPRGEPMKFDKDHGDLPYCEDCRSYHHPDLHKKPKPLIDEIFNANTLPSSPTDKCAEVFDKWWDEWKGCGLGRPPSTREIAKEVWQASRKDMEESRKNLIASYEKRNFELVKKEIEIARLKQELENWRGHYQDEAKRRCKLQEHIASLQSVVEAKDEALNSIRNELGVPQPGYLAPVANAYEIATKALELPDPSALHIDQSGGKKEEEGTYKVLFDESLRTPSATPVSPHVDTVKHTSMKNIELLKKDDGYWLSIQSELGPAMINLNCMNGSIVKRNFLKWAEEQISKSSSAKPIFSHDSLSQQLEDIRKRSKSYYFEIGIHDSSTDINRLFEIISQLQEALEWLASYDYQVLGEKGHYFVWHPSAEERISQDFNTPIEAILSVMSKSRENTTCAEAPLNSKKSASASSTAISTEEGKK